ncbi:uncharacterized protein LOC119682093 [Teleopsis dalmanni]|uniref:uncharacterized protein LOC119682093 n=1 Tax=Teleopsis dalmanni TaxID=139649 RepID=UPI000D32A4F8|nr:uncharacterized protein LOC119682093 [Teleopsis dalmanni]
MSDKGQDKPKSGKKITKEMKSNVSESLPSAHPPAIENSEKSLNNAEGMEPTTEGLTSSWDTPAQHNAKDVHTDKDDMIEENEENITIPIDDSEIIADLNRLCIGLQAYDNDEGQVTSSPIQDCLAEMEKDVKEMKSDLDKNYEKLMSAAQRLESIDFQSIQQRFLDNINITEPLSKPSVDELKNLFELSYVNNTLSGLIDQVTKEESYQKKFDIDIPGIPELADVCKTLNESFSMIKDQHRKCDEIKFELHEATEDTRARIEEIKKILKTEAPK